MKNKLLTLTLGLMLAITITPSRPYADQAAPATPTQETQETQAPEILNGLINKNGAIYYYKDNVPVKDQLLTVEGSTYYFTAGGAALTNSWKTISGAKYYFGANGAAYQRSRKIGDLYYVFKLNGQLCTGDKKRIVKVDGVRYYVGKTGKVQTGWQPVNGKMIYADASGKLATNCKISYIKLGSKGYAVNKWQAIAKYYARRFIDKHTKPQWSKKKKLRKCFWYLKKHMRYVAHYVRDKKAISSNGWQYKAAADMLSTRRLAGNCRCWASAFSAIAKELGYQPYVRSMSWHSVVRINGKYYDYIKGGWFCVRRRPYFTKFLKTFKF